MMLFVGTVILIPLILVQIIFIFRNKEEALTPIIVIVSGSLIFIELILRSFQIGFPALTNTFEAFLFFSASILIITGIYRIRFNSNKIISFGGTIIALILLLLCSSPLVPDQLHPPIPALQSNWLLLHVSFAFIGEAFFVISFVSAIASLITKDKFDYYHKIVIKSIVVGYPIYTAGAIIFGSIWAANAWGSFWSWDPKETWALITWFIYTVIIHGRHSKHLKDRTLSWLSIIGFLVSIFTFIGVNFLLPSLHSYNG